MLGDIIQDKPKKVRKKVRLKRFDKLSESSKRRRRRAKDNPNKNPVGHPIREDKKRLAKSLRLHPDSWKYVKKIGNGSYTAGIDELISEHRLRRML